eukprot:3462143-Alexandrium_andersonii.AAC.1
MVAAMGGACCDANICSLQMCPQSLSASGLVGGNVRLEYTGPVGVTDQCAEERKRGPCEPLRGILLTGAGALSHCDADELVGDLVRRGGVSQVDARVLSYTTAVALDVVTAAGAEHVDVAKPRPPKRKPKPKPQAKPPPDPQPQPPLGLQPSNPSSSDSEFDFCARFAAAGSNLPGANALAPMI